MTPRKTPSEDQVREAIGEVGDALQRAIVLSHERIQSVLEDAVVRGRMTRRDAEEVATNLITLGRDQAFELRGEVDALARSIQGRVVDAVTPGGKKRRKRRRDEDDAARREAEAFVEPKKAKPAGSAPKAKAAASKAKAAATKPKASATKPKASATKPKAAASKSKAAASKPKSAAKPAASPQAGSGALPAEPSTVTVRELVALLPSLSAKDLETLRERESAGKARKTVLAAIDARTAS